MWTSQNSELSPDAVADEVAIAQVIKSRDFAAN